MVRAAGLTAAVCAAVAAVSSAQTTAPRPPNVIIIVADDLGWADVGYQGLAKDLKTPNIDALAAEGARFTQAYVSAPVCSPSRAGLLTGRYQERFGHEQNPAPQFDGTFGLPLSERTIADALRARGYATGLCGKWHLGSQPDYRPPKRGFDEFYGFLGGAHGYLRPGVGDNAVRRGDERVEKVDYLTDAISDEAVGFIERHKAMPFLLCVTYNAVHTPQEAPAKYQERFAGVQDPRRKMMLAMLSALDDGVGRIAAALEKQQLERETLVVFFSDNGGPGGNGTSNRPLRGYKGQLWEGGIRVPMAMRWTGRIKPGTVVERPVITLDIGATALAAAGVPAREKQKLDGVDLMPLLTGFANDAPHETLYWRFRPQWAIRDGDYKLVQAWEEEKASLFDLSKDPGETTDLSARLPEVVKKLREKYAAWEAELVEPLWPGKQEGANQPNARKAPSP